MKKGIFRRALPVLFTLAQLGTIASAQTPAHTLRDLSFLKGSWYGNGKGGSYIEEYWSGAEGNSIVGHCRFI